MQDPDSRQTDAFADFYRQHVQFVYGIALSYVHNPQDAEDITADLFVQLLEAGRTFEDDMHARAWLTVAVRNRCKNHLRSWLHRRRDDDAELEAIPEDGMQEELREVMTALYRLPERYRLPLLLFAVQGYSIRETAQILKLNESTVRTRIARARAIIKKETGVDDT